VRWLAIGMATILAALAALHVSWALGGRWAAAAAVPEGDGRPLFRPGPGTTLIVAGCLTAAAAVVLEGAGIGLRLLSPWVAKWGTWGVAATFAARAVGDFRLVGFFKRVRGTPFARMDSVVYSPLCLALGVGCAVVAASGR